MQELVETMRKIVVIGRLLNHPVQRDIFHILSFPFEPESPKVPSFWEIG
jgi:hypothetical protein